MLVLACAIASQAPGASASTRLPGGRPSVNFGQALTVTQVGRLCSKHPRGRYRLWIRGYFVQRTVYGRSNGRGGMGGLYSKRAGPYIRASDSTPFVLVEYPTHAPGWITKHWVIVRGLLDCAQTPLPVVIGTIFIDAWRPAPAHV